MVAPTDKLTQMVVVITQATDNTPAWATKPLNRSVIIYARVAAQPWSNIHDSDSKISQRLNGLFYNLVILIIFLEPTAPALKKF